MDLDMRVPMPHSRMVRTFAPLVVAAFACQELEQPLGDAPVTGEGGADAENGGTAGNTDAMAGGTDATGDAGDATGGTKTAGSGGSATAGTGGAPPTEGGASTSEGGAAAGELGEGGKPSNPDVRFVVVGPLDPASTTPRAGINYSTDWVGADSSGSVFAGYSSSPDPASVVNTGVRFLWTEEAGTVRLPYSSPAAGMYAPTRLSGDGKSLFGEVMKLQALPANGLQFGPISFYRWTAESGDVPFGPSEAMWNGQIDFVSPDGKTAIGLVEFEADVQAGNDPTRSFRWTESRGFELLSTLGWPDPSGCCTTVNEDLTALGGLDGDGGFLWFDPDRFVPLTGTPDFPHCSASSISRDGTVAFGGCTSAHSELEEATAFRWTAETGMVTIDVPAGISATGDGRLAFSTDGQALYRWSATTGSTRLEPPVDWPAGRVYWLELPPGGLSEDGSTIYGQLSVAVGERLDTPEQSSFRWSEADGFVRLAALPGHGESWIQGQTPDGSVQVGLSRLGQSSNAVLWDCAGVRDIARELSDGGAELLGVHLSSASGVWGGSTLMITGSGEAEGNRVAWLAWLPTRC